MTSYSFKWITSLTRLEDEERWSSPSRVGSWYLLLTLMVLRSIPSFFGRLYEFFWLHFLLINHKVDVVPGERQSFMVMVFQALTRIPCPSVHCANTNRFWWRHYHKAGRKGKWNTERKMVMRTKDKHYVFTNIDITGQGIECTSLREPTLFS